MTDKPHYEITLNYTVSMLKKSVWLFWMRTLNWKFMAAMLLLTMGLVSAFIHGDTSWTTGAIAVILALGIIFSIVLYVSQYQHVLGTFNALQKPYVHFGIYEDKFTLSSDLGEGSWPWSAIKEIWQYSDRWLVFLAKSSYATFPLAEFPKEAQTFVLNKLKQSGTLIK